MLKTNSSQAGKNDRNVKKKRKKKGEEDVWKEGEREREGGMSRQSAIIRRAVPTGIRTIGHPYSEGIKEQFPASSCLRRDLCIIDTLIYDHYPNHRM